MYFVGQPWVRATCEGRRRSCDLLPRPARMSARVTELTTRVRTGNRSVSNVTPVFQPAHARGGAP